MISPTPHPPARWTIAAALLSVLALAAIAYRAPQGLYSDPAWQLIGVRQFLAGQSPTPNSGRTPVAADFSTDRVEWVTWWAPGTPFLAVGPMWLGLSIGASVRAIALVFLAAGAVGWALWIAAFDLPPPVAIAIAGLVPWMRYASNGIFEFSAETLIFGAAPWALLVALRSGRAGQAAARPWTTAAVVGAAVGVVYWLKYSWVLAAVGVIGWWAVRRAGSVARAVVAISGMAAPIAALSLLNVVLAGQANVATATASLHPSPVTWVAAIGAPSVMWFDLEAALRYVLMRPAAPLIVHTWWPLVAGVPGAVWLLFLARGLNRDAHGLALSIWISSVALAIVTWTVTSASVEGRHVATAGLATLPLVVSLTIRDWREAGAARRLCGAAVLVAYVALPAAYGVVSVGAKVRRIPAGYRTGAANLYNPLLSATDVNSCRAVLSAGFDPQRDTWYLTDPGTALDLSGRAIVVHADFESLEQLRTTYRTSKPGRVEALLPASFESNGKGDVIRASFPQASGWTKVTVPCTPQLWVATLDTASSASGPR